MEEEKLNNLIYLLRIHHIDSEPLENLIKGYKKLEEYSDDLLSQNEMFKDMYDEEVYKNKKLEEENRNIKNHIYYKGFVELNYIPKSKVREFFEKSKVVKNESKDKTYLLIDVSELNEELL